MNTLSETVDQLVLEVRALKAEAEARRLLGRYMFLCDTPLPEHGMSEQDRAGAIGDLFTEDAIWEGVGGTHGAQFGRQVGPAQIAAHMLRFHLDPDPARVFNTHYVCTEQVRATPDGAEGQWVQFQPWIYADGTSVIRSSRLHVQFRPTEAGWKISRYRTENLLIGELPDGWTQSRIERALLMAPEGVIPTTPAPAPAAVTRPTPSPQRRRKGKSAMSAVTRLGYVNLRVTDLEEARNHYSNTLGMEVVHEEAGKVYLKCWDEWDHHSLVLEEGGVGLAKFGYKVEGPDALADFEERALKFGATLRRFSAGDNLKVGEGVQITMPSEHTLELYYDMEFAGTETGAINPESWPRNVRGVGTHWIDHALISVEDPALVERFMSEVLDFRAAERAIESIENPNLLGSWMTCGESPHDLAFIKGPNGKLHHFAYHLEDWSSILRAGDIFSMDDVPIDIGPTRHGITRGTTIYFFDPAGNRNEVFAGLGYRAQHDFPTINWTADQLAKGIFYHARELNEAFTSVFT